MRFGDDTRSKVIFFGAVGALSFGVIFTLWLVTAWVLSPGANEFYVLIGQTGETLPPGRILAGPGQKGVQKELHTAGWAFYCPIWWDAERHTLTVVPAGHMGILTALDGEDMPSGQVLARVLERDAVGNILRCQKGTIEDVLMPGAYRIHPYWFKIDVRPAVEVPAGSVGIVTAKAGRHLPDGQLLAKEGERGVREKVLEPGLHFLNPQGYKVDTISIRSHRLDLLKEAAHDDSIEFPSSDGFPILIDAAIEWRIKADKVAEVFSRLGDEQRILDNVIRPNARSISRIEGSKYKATDFISGLNREKFELSFFTELHKVADAKGVEVMRALVRKITVPEDIARPIREAEVARQEKLRNIEQIETQKSAAQLAKEKALVEQQTKQIDAETLKIVAETRAKQELAVAEVALQTAQKEAQSTVARGKADADVILAKKKAEAEGYKAVVDAFGGGPNYAMFNFTQMVAEHTTFVFAPVGEGTFWTDPNAFFKLAGAKAMQDKNAGDQNK